MSEEVASRFQAFRESGGHALTRQAPPAEAQQGVDVDPDLDPEEVQGDPDIAPEVDVAALQEKKKQAMMRAAMKLKQGSGQPTHTAAPVSNEPGYLTGDFPEEEGVDTGEPTDTGEPMDTGEPDTGEPLDTGSPFDTGDTGGDYEPPTVNAQGVEINEEAVTGQTGHGEGLVDDYDQMHDVLEDYQKTQIYGAAGVPEAEHHAAAKTDRHRDRREREEVWSGDGPDGRGELYFYDGDPPRGYWLKEDGTWVNVTGMLYPPGWSS